MPFLIQRANVKDVSRNVVQSSPVRFITSCSSPSFSRVWAMYSVSKKLFPISIITSLIGFSLNDLSTARLNFELQTSTSFSEKI